MASQLVCRPEQDLPVGVLRVSGVLDMLTDDALARAVARSLSAQPERLLIDVTHLDIRDLRALESVGEVLSLSAEWPAVPVILCGAPDGAAALAAQWPECSVVRTAEDCARALADTPDEPEPRRIRTRLRPVPDACRQARYLVDQVCARWDRREIAATATLVATELVANVVRHAHTSMEFTVGLRDDLLCLTVRDHSRRMPRTVDPTHTDAGGRGLRLVRELTQSWGVMPVPGGKVVWTRLAAGSVA